MQLDSTHSEVIQILTSDTAEDFGKIENCFRCLLKHYLQTIVGGNQTSLVQSTSAGKKDPNKPLVEKKRNKRKIRRELLLLLLVLLLLLL